MEWLDIPGFYKYQASTCGKIRNKKTGHVMATRVNEKGYEKIRLYGSDFFVHRLVYMAHENIRKWPEGYFINHTNMDKLDNHIDNLEMVTVAENNKHRALWRKAMT